MYVSNSIHRSVASYYLEIADEKPVFGENYDLDNVITPFNVNKLEELLEDAGYDPEKTRILVDGFRFGFGIGYNGPKIRRSTAENILFSVGNKVILWNKVMKEVKLGRVAGPYKSPPFDNFIQSPVGLVPKSGRDQTRLIFHLSYDCK